MNATEEFLTEAFMEQGLVSQELIDQILAEAKEQAGSDGEDELNLLFFSLLLDQLGLSKEEVVNFLGAELSMPTVDLSTISLTPEVLGLLSPEHARFY
jgi:hypothetical protein